ncbi:hypothetical protein [Streptomyces sp. x-80]
MSGPVLGVVRLVGRGGGGQGRFRGAKGGAMRVDPWLWFLPAGRFE